MDDAQWERLNKPDVSIVTEMKEFNIINRLKSGQTFTKFKSNGRLHLNFYYLIESEDAINFCHSQHKTEYEACKIKRITQIRAGFTTTVWKKCLEKGIINEEKSNLAFSILFNNNRYSLDLLAESEQICSEWIESLEYLVNRYHSHLCTYDEIIDQWLNFSFTHADRDHSNYLNRDEIEKLLSTLNIKLNKEEIEKYFKQANIRKDNYEDLTSLDKDEFLAFYKFISHRPELLKIICRFNESTPEQTAATLSQYDVISKLAHINPLEQPQNTSLVHFHTPKKRGIFSRRHRRRHRRPSSSNVIDKKDYLTVKQLKDFLEKEQHTGIVSDEDASKLIDRFEPSDNGRKYNELSIDGFRLLLLHDEFCIVNLDKIQRVYHDMTRPITDYFIATSHNTYIRGNQVYGNCTCETFIHALRIGCRAVELDCYDGVDMEPIIYHGKTLTKPITFREVISAIETEAFTFSPYPLFLNIENHCSYNQQGVMARHLKDILKDHLLSKPLEDDFQSLPSPDDLKYKIIIRSRRHRKGEVPTDSQSNESDDETEPNPKDYNPEFSHLLFYSEIVSFKNVNHTISTPQCFHSMSFKESAMNKLISGHTSEHLDIIKLSNKHLIRIYPGTKRQNSSNTHPVSYWTYGIQMVALNYQANDEAMWLQQGFFSDNGGCGYLLKPSFLLSDEQIFNPKEKIHENMKHLQIHIISAQHLPKEKDSIQHHDIVDPYVEVITYGIQSDHTKHRNHQYVIMDLIHYGIIQ
ncbi:hypothetical protein I4U23_003948 [Adineta vaga]|nr:hypothetical protein I4U23_003948 [Adineta vaga]